MTAIAAYEAGLLGRADCWLRPDDGLARPVPLTRWTAAAGPGDELMLSACRAGRRGPVLDVGCGPGRLTAALASAGMPAVGIDVSAVAVRLARARGVTALHRDVFAAVPAEGGWGCALLADGNIGIGGDPLALLARLRRLLAVGGRVVAEVQAAGGVRRGRHWLEAHHSCGARTGGPLPWAWVGADAAAALGRRAGLGPVEVLRCAGRTVAIWRKDTP